MTGTTEVQHGTEAYDRTVVLRDDILRAPLGLAFSPEELAGESDSFHLACWRGDTLLACVVLKPLPNRQIRMRQLAVQTGFQGQGIGRLLVLYSESFAKERGFREMVLHARESALGFYEKLSYEKKGDRFTEVTLPHYAMEKSLAAAAASPSAS